MRKLSDTTAAGMFHVDPVIDQNTALCVAGRAGSARAAAFAQCRREARGGAEVSQRWSYKPKAARLEPFLRCHQPCAQVGSPSLRAGGGGRGVSFQPHLHIRPLEQARSQPVSRVTSGLYRGRRAALRVHPFSWTERSRWEPRCCCSTTGSRSDICLIPKQRFSP